MRGAGGPRDLGFMLEYEPSYILRGLAGLDLEVGKAR